MDGCVFIAPHDILIQLIGMICKPSVVMLTVFAKLSLCVVDWVSTTSLTHICIEQCDKCCITLLSGYDNTCMHVSKLE